MNGLQAANQVTTYSNNSNAPGTQPTVVNSSSVQPQGTAQQPSTKTAVQNSYLPNQGQGLQSEKLRNLISSKNAQQPTGHQPPTTAATSSKELKSKGEVGPSNANANNF